MSTPTSPTKSSGSYSEIVTAAINSNHNKKVVKRVLVTGGNGFIGRDLVSRLLEADCHVRILIRSALHTPAQAGVEIAEGDVRRSEERRVGEECRSGVGWREVR